jgi:hypothetical protein
MYCVLPADEELNQLNVECTRTTHILRYSCLLLRTNPFEHKSPSSSYSNDYSSYFTFIMHNYIYYFSALHTETILIQIFDDIYSYSL